LQACIDCSGGKLKDLDDEAEPAMALAGPTSVKEAALRAAQAGDAASSLPPALRRAAVDIAGRRCGSVRAGPRTSSAVRHK
jgi:hypothetical protein